jgi:hypothetical protein
VACAGEYLGADVHCGHPSVSSTISLIDVPAMCEVSWTIIEDRRAHGSLLSLYVESDIASPETGTNMPNDR